MQRALLAGLLVTLLQIAMALCAAQPELTLGQRYRGLVQHDSYWFMNIVTRGYGTTMPPVDHKVMEVSNVAFFPAYPLLAKAIAFLLRLNPFDALLVTAQLAAWGFWTYFFLFAERWQLRPALRWFGALAIVAHPAAFFLIAGYSESLFLMALAGFVYWSGAEGRAAKVLAGAHGFLMSATRIVGLVCAGYPVVRALFIHRWKSWRAYRPAVVLSFVAMLGAVAFFAWCQLRWGRWDLYMLTQKAGWAIQPDYLAVFRPANYHWFIPPLDNASLASQLTTSLAALLFVVIAVGELLTALRRNTGWSRRIGLYFCAFAIFAISVAGVASVQLESMLRYDLCVHALIVLALLHYLRQLRLPPVPVRALAMAAVALLSAAGLSLECWYVFNFTQGYWIA